MYAYHTYSARTWINCRHLYLQGTGGPSSELKIDSNGESLPLSTFVATLCRPTIEFIHYQDTTSNKNTHTIIIVFCGVGYLLPRWAPSAGVCAVPRAACRSEGEWRGQETQPYRQGKTRPVQGEGDQETARVPSRRHFSS